MKITVKGDDMPFAIKIPIPNAMLGSSLLARFVELPMDFDPKQGKQLARCLKWMRKNYPGVPLIEVVSSTGEEVTIMP